MGMASKRGMPLLLTFTATKEKRWTLAVTAKEKTGRSQCFYHCRCKRGKGGFPGGRNFVLGEDAPAGEKKLTPDLPEKIGKKKLLPHK